MSLTSRIFLFFTIFFFGIFPTVSFAAATTVSVSPSSVASGENITITWTAPAGHSLQDWIGIFPVGSGNNVYNNWGYVGSGTSGTMVLAATDSVGAPLPGGSYEIRYKLDNFYTEPVPAARAQFTITGGGTSGPYCGDASCNNGETTMSCPGDCPSTGPVCGDSVCNGSETNVSCPGDCPPGAGGGTTAPPGLFFGASPSVISAGQSTTISWSGSNVTSCIASGDAAWTGAKPTAGSATFANMSEGAKTYTLSCQTASGGTISSDAQVFVGPAPVPVIFLSATPSTLASGGNVTLSWSSSNAVSCTGSGNTAWSTQNPKPTSGTITFTDVQQSTTYSISCVNSTGQSSPVQSAGVVVGPALTFGVSPATIDSGGKPLLSWTASSNITSCTPGGFTGTISLPTGSMLVQPPQSTSYSLTCRTADVNVPPVTKNAAVAVKPVFLKFEAVPDFLNTTGGSSTFTWQASPNAISCDVSGDWNQAGIPISGTKVFSNLTKTQNFTLSCITSDNLLVTDKSTIAVVALPVISSFTVDKPTINSGETVVATWTVSGATSCVGKASGGEDIIVESTDGTHSYTIPNITQSSVLGLTCTGADNAPVYRTASITVRDVPPPDSVHPTLTLTVDKSVINSGDSVVATWTVSGATSCVGASSAGGAQDVDSTDGTHSLTIPNMTQSASLSITCHGNLETVTAQVRVDVAASQAQLCQGVGVCKLSTDTCNGTRQSTSDCTGGTICCVVGGGITSSGQWVSSPNPNGVGLLISLIGSSISSWQPTPSGSGWQMIQSSSQSFDPVLNSNGTLQIIPNGNSTWQVLPATGSTFPLGNVQFASSGNGGWNLTPVAGSSTGIGGGGGGCNILTDPNGCFESLGPPTPSTESSGLVPCGFGDAPAGATPQDLKNIAEQCQFEDFIKLAKNVMNFLLFDIAMPIAAISFAWAGWLYLSSAGNEGNVKRAHEIFANVVLGLSLALAAWLIVNAIVLGLGVADKYNFLKSG